MLDLATWAARWGIPPQALAELAAPAALEPVIGLTGTSEAHVQTAQRLSAARAGIHAWRNNVGALLDQTGRMVRFGLANDSKRLNEHLKSSDLVGIKRHTVTFDDIGKVMGVWWCRECKPVGWHYTGTPREQAQLRFITLINANGGDAAFTTGGE